ncbi:glycosyltransferase [Streptomyces sp. NRRL WC-3742]|uniref:glycosyltransferase n=1 Tax=Streptomyces sp. NRRL WC-3742 TaxID=1463934 RepID=UPI0004C47BEB|nr:nucleotide disphospho-sugar-binding domain-containing protein [Streptomyces sp. NRRL WC-3742]
MQVILSTYGSRGDVQPLAALALRLRAHGVPVTVCAPPDEEHARSLGALGVETVPVGESVRALVTGRLPVKGDIQTRAAVLAARFREAVSSLAGPGDVVVATGLFPTVAGAQAAAERAGARFHHAALQPTALPSPHHRPFEYPMLPYPPEVTDVQQLWDLNIGTMNTLFGEAVNTARAAAGLAAVDNVRDHVNGESPWLATDPVLDPWPQAPEPAVRQTGAWLLPDERPLPDGLSAFLDAGEAPVYVGYGSMPLPGAPDAAEVAIAAARAQGRRIVLARGWAGLTGADGAADCHVVGEVNQQALFPRCAALVHHGGAGTTTAATIAGTPQVVVPQIVDQPYWARRVAELGLGAAHDGPTATVDSLAAALDTALAAPVRDRAREVAALVRTDGAEAAARLVLDA